MKRIAQTLLVVSFATSGVAALGASSVNETSSMVDSFPNIRTYADSHKNDPVVASNTAAFPSSVNETSSMADSFPGIQTYADLHKNDPVWAGNSVFPISVSETGPNYGEGYAVVRAPSAAARTAAAE